MLWASAKKFTVNNKGQKISKTDLNPHGYSLRYEYIDENLVKETGDFHQWVFFYNDQDQLIKQILFYDSADTISSTSYVYNNLRQIAQVTHYDYKTKATSVEQMTYNSYGDINEKTDDGIKLIYLYDYFK